MFCLNNKFLINVFLHTISVCLVEMTFSIVSSMQRVGKSLKSGIYSIIFLEQEQCVKCELVSIIISLWEQVRSHNI